MSLVRPLRAEDVPAAQALMADTWSCLLRARTGLNVQYPVRPASWYLARLRHEPLGCLCVEDEGEIIGTGFALSSGNVGWIGPMEVGPRHQGKGHGTRLLGALEAHLVGSGCGAIGLETMKDVPRNLDFYARNGYVKEQDTLYLEKGLLKPSPTRSKGEGADLEEVRRLAATINPGFDPSSEFQMHEEMGDGRTLLAKSAAALLLLDPIPGSGKAYLRIVLTDGSGLDKAIGLVQRAEGEASRAGARTMFTIVPERSELLPLLMRSGYRPKGTDVRLMKGEFQRRHERHIISWSG